jgi:hypothetical protein
VHVNSDLQAVPAAQRDTAIRGAETRPALIHGPTRRAPTGQDSADVPERNHRDQWATLGEDRRARRSTVERQIVLLEARRLELVTHGCKHAPTEQPRRQDLAPPYRALPRALHRVGTDQEADPASEEQARTPALSRIPQGVGDVRPS